MNIFVCTAAYVLLPADLSAAQCVLTCVRSDRMDGRRSQRHALGAGVKVVPVVFPPFWRRPRFFLAHYLLAF